MKAGTRKVLLGSGLGIVAGFIVIAVVLPEPLPVRLTTSGPVEALSEPLPHAEAALPDGGRPLSELGQQRLRALFRLPPRASPLVSIGDEVQTNKVPMNLASFETTDDWQEVLEFYAKEFELKKWPMYGAKQLKGITPYPAISATLMDEELQVSVVAMPHEDDEGTTVILGVADMGRWRGNLSTPETGDLPVYPGTAPLAVQSIDEGMRALTVSFDTADAPATVASFYARQLGEKGYRPMESAGEGPLGASALVFVSNERRWTLALLTEGTRTSVTAQAQEVTP